jgi:hypothetical protein
MVLWTNEAPSRTLKGKAALDFLLRALRRHEGYGWKGINRSGHMQATKAAITAGKALGDPRRYAEAAYHPSRTSLEATISDCLTKTNEAIYRHMLDPIRPDTRRRTEWRWSPEANRYWRLEIEWPHTGPAGALELERSLDLPERCLRRELR